MKAQWTVKMTPKTYLPIPILSRLKISAILEVQPFLD